MGSAERAKASDTDEELFLAFRDRGDESALDGLIGRHWSRTFRLALGLVRDPGAAEDVAQEAFVQVIAAARAKKTLDPFGGWLTTVVLNGARKAQRSARRRGRHEDVARANRPEEATVTPSSIDEYAALLPDELAAPVLLHYGLGLTQVETAAALGCPPGTVASRLRSGLDRLRTSVGASVAIEAGLAESWSPVREAQVPSAPRAAHVVARALAHAPGSLAPVRGGLTLPGTGVAILLASALVLTVGGLAFVGLSRGAPDGPAAGESALAPPTSAGAPGTVPGKGSRGSAALAPAGSSTIATHTALALAPPATVELDDEGALALAPEDLGEPESRAPRYPWREYSPEERAAIAENERRLSEHTLSLDFDRVPLAGAVAWWNDLAPDLGVPSLFLDEHADTAVVSDLKVSLRVRDITAKNALNLICATSDQLTFDVEPAAVRIATSGAQADPALEAALRRLQIDALPSRRPRQMTPLTAEEVEGQRAAAERFKNVLSQTVEYDFFETPLVDVVDKLADLTGVSFTVSKTVDMEVVKLTGSSHGPKLGDSLPALLASGGLMFALRNETVMIVPPEENQAPRALEGLWLAPAALDLRGVTLREVVTALSRIGVTAIVSPEAWRSMGTFSVVTPPGATIKQLLGRFPQLGVRKIDAEEDDSGHTKSLRVVLSGEVPSAREALAAPLPRFPGVAKQVRELRVRLVAALRARRVARAVPSTEGAALLQREAAVAETSGSILDLVHRASALERARDRRAALTGLEALNLQVSEAHRRVALAGEEATPRDRCALSGLEARRDELEYEIAEAAKAVALVERLEKGEPLPPAEK